MVRRILRLRSTVQSLEANHFNIFREWALMHVSCRKYAGPINGWAANLRFFLATPRHHIVLPWIHLVISDCWINFYISSDLRNWTKNKTRAFFQRATHKSCRKLYFPNRSDNFERCVRFVRYWIRKFVSADILQGERISDGPDSELDSVRMYGVKRIGECLGVSLNQPLHLRSQRFHLWSLYTSLWLAFLGLGLACFQNIFDARCWYGIYLLQSFSIGFLRQLQLYLLRCILLTWCAGHDALRIRTHSIPFFIKLALYFFFWIFPPLLA